MRVLILALAILLCAAGQAAAAVELTFYSRDVKVRFPHAFVTLRGTLDATGEVVDANYGFTPQHVSPAVLMGPVGGKVVSVDPPYVTLSTRHFAVVLTDAQYRAVIGEVDAWRERAQPNYSLESRNCVFFVGALAAAAGLDGAPEAGLMKKPRSFLERLRDRNQALIARRTGPGAPETAPAVARR